MNDANQAPQSTAAHVDKSTLTVQVYDPEHAQRVTTALFTRTRDEVLAHEPVCWMCGQLPSVVGPLELHHNTVERMFAEITDFALVKDAAMVGEVGWTPGQREANKSYDWDAFLSASPFDPYAWVDNMHLNGIPICKAHHTGQDEGIHNMDYPRWLAQRYVQAGYKYSDVYTVDTDELRIQAITEDDKATQS
jgi:hypothetical protein